MKEPYGEGVANHSGPESCADARKGAGEALTGVRAGRVLSPEKSRNPGADLVARRGRPHWKRREREALSRPGVVPDPAHARKLLAREPGDPVADRGARVPRPALGIRKEKPTMHGPGKSDGCVVPLKSSNNGRASLLPAESPEERHPAKGNPGQQPRVRTQCRSALSHAPAWIRQPVTNDGPLSVTPLSIGLTARQDLRQEPGAGNPHAGICAGGAG